MVQVEKFLKRTQMNNRRQSKIVKWNNYFFDFDSVTFLNKQIFYHVQQIFIVCTFKQSKFFEFFKNFGINRQLSLLLKQVILSFFSQQRKYFVYFQYSFRPKFEMYSFFLFFFTEFQLQCFFSSIHRLKLITLLNLIQISLKLLENDIKLRNFCILKEKKYCFLILFRNNQKQQLSRNRSPTSEMNRITIFLLALLITQISPVCLDPNQPDGSCTACNSLDILLEQNCYPKMRGCLDYELPGPVCILCQFGYVLVPAKKCVREAVVSQVNPIQIPPVTIDNETLTLNAIKTKVGPQLNPFFTDAHEMFVSTRPELGLGNIQNVETLQTKRGTYFIINYKQTKTSTNYEAVAFLNPQNKMVPLYFKNGEVQKKDPFTANNKIRQILGAKLTNFFIYNIDYSQPIYTINYMNDSLNVYTVSFSMNDIGPLLSSKLNVKSLTAMDLALDQLYKIYPEFKTKTILSKNKYEDFYAFSFDGNLSASVRFYLFVFTVNKPIQISGNIPTFDNFISLFDPLGFLSLFGIYDYNYKKCIDVAMTQLPEIKSAAQSNIVSKKVNSDTYYRISMQKFFFGDAYDIYSVLDSTGTCKLLIVLKNSQTTLYSARYNYNADPLFFRGYVNATLVSKVVTIPAIDSVTMKVNGTTTYYKAIYSPSQFIQFTYNRTSNVTKLISYTVDGANILGILNAVGQTEEKTQPDLYMTLVQKKSQTPPSSVISFLPNFQNTFLKFVSNTGTYEANVGNTYQLASISQVSDQNCYSENNLNDKKIKKIINFIKQFYRLDAFNVIFVQVMVRKVGNLYRILTCNAALKHVQFIVQQFYTIPNVVKVITYNDGYEYVQPTNLSSDYQKFISLTGSQNPLMVESTSKKIRGYLNDGKSTKQIVLDKSSGTISPSIYQSYEGIASHNCLTTDPTGKCLSCDQTKLLYIGSCYNKIQGCKIQAGKNCLRCNNPYVLKDKVCKKDCVQLLQQYRIY